MSQSSKLELLLKWFDDNDVQWDKDSLEIKETNGSFGVHAKKNLRKDTTVVKIPKESILSIKTTGIANLLDEANIEGGCPLALAVMYEIAQKEQSPWYGYLQALPEQGEDLPIFWAEEEKDLFKGTEMESAVRNDLNDLEDDYNELIVPLLEEHPYIFVRGNDLDNDDYSLDKFIKISTLISSRAFEVDSFHENALVPFADIFNHRGDNEHVHFETEFEVCDACGAPDYCEHQYVDFLEGQEGSEDENEGKEGGDESSEEEIKGSSNEEEWEDEDEEEDMELDTELPDLEELEEAGIDFYEKDDDDEEDKKDTCDMVLDRMVKKGEEVFNTYGDHPNIALLSKYGFCYDDNKNDYVSVDENALVDCCLAISAELLKDEAEDASEEDLQNLAVTRTRPRWEFFLTNEHILCPQEGDEEEEPRDDYEDDDCQDDCCGGDGHDHDHGHGEEDEHEHDEDGGCCGGEEEEGKGRPYFINYEGLFEDKIMCLLHIMFVDESIFNTFTEDIQNALDYFENLSKSQSDKKSKEMMDVKRKVYQTCLALAEFRRLEYLEDGQWKPIKQELKERDEAYENRRKYYALTCRIGEKKIIEKGIKYYENLVKEYSGQTPKNNKKKNPKKHKKAKH